MTGSQSAERYRNETGALDATKDSRQGRRAALGSYLGATLEFCDFVLYAIGSALAFPAASIQSQSAVAASAVR